MPTYMERLTEALSREDLTHEQRTTISVAIYSLRTNKKRIAAAHAAPVKLPYRLDGELVNELADFSHRHSEMLVEKENKQQKECTAFFAPLHDHSRVERLTWTRTASGKKIPIITDIYKK